MSTSAEASRASSPQQNSRFWARISELARFGSVGAVAFVVDIGLFNLLRFGPGGLMADHPEGAKVASAAVATLVAWLGNRYWTFSDRKSANRWRELVGFVAVNLGGILIGVGCLAFSQRVLGLDSPLADNISANVVGLGLGTIFRYIAYRHLVFTGDSGTDAQQSTDTSALQLEDDSATKQQ